MTRNVSDVDIDISLIINVYRDVKYFRRTMLSLEEAARYTKTFGLKLELIVVLDRSDDASTAWFESYDPDHFDAAKIVKVDNGCLGLSRNDGIRAASGVFIATFDTDDLVSFNYLAALYDVALRSPENVLVFPEYLFGFGTNHFLFRIYPRPQSSLLAFVTDHPLISRFLTRRSTFDSAQFADLHVSKGYAYEDWQFNAEMIGRKFEYAVATNTVIFYRQRRGSLLKAFDGTSVKQIPAAELFHPETFVSVCADDYARFRRGERTQDDAAAIRAEFLASPLNLPAAFSANRLDAAIDISVLAQVPVFTNRQYDLRPGAAYFEIAREIRGLHFTDVVLFPFVTTGGGEKYIFEVLHTLKALDPSRRFLLVTGQGGVRHKWIERLPQDTFFLDIYNRYPELSNAQREIVVLKLIQMTAPTATLHLKCSQFAQDFFTRFASVLTSTFNVAYRFSDQLRLFEGYHLTNGYSADFISEHMEALDLVISDNRRLMSRDLELMDCLEGKVACLYTHCELADAPLPDPVPRKATKRLLWASRLDPEKRPELLYKIASALSIARGDLSIDVWGESFSNFDTKDLAALDNVRLRGGYSGFSSLEPSQYDAFIYTTAYDGLPNVVVEAMASGLPVVAPDVGGIAEAVQSGQTGVLLKNAASDGDMVSAYLHAIDWLYEASDRLATLGRGASEHVQARHGAAAYSKQVAAIFRVGAPEDAAMQKVTADETH